jgi:uncharacterized protein YgiB involved in biofilm formation
MRARKKATSRRSSLRITLVLAGSASLYACESGEPRYVNRDVYANAADCQRDWGDKSCEQTRPPAGAGMAAPFLWYGPSYFSDHTRPRGSRAMSTASTSNFSASSRSSVSRGGFGSSSSMHSSGG